MRAVKKVFSHRVQVVKGGNNKEKKSKETESEEQPPEVEPQEHNDNCVICGFEDLQKKLNGCNAQGKNIEKQWQ